MAITEMFANWQMFFKNKMQIGKGYWDNAEVMMWANYLTQKQLTLGEFKQAKIASLERDYPPTNPKEFLDLVRHKFADTHKAYIEATHQRYIDEIAYETASRVGFYELRTQSEKTMYPLWQKHYAQVCEEVRNGTIFTLPQSQQIAMQPHQPLQFEEAIKHIEQMKKYLGGATA